MEQTAGWEGGTPTKAKRRIEQELVAGATARRPLTPTSGAASEIEGSRKHIYVGNSTTVGARPRSPESANTR